MSARIDVAVHNSELTILGACSAARDVFAALGGDMPKEYRVRHHLSDVSRAPWFTTVKFEGEVVRVTVYLPDLSDTEPEGRRSL